MGYSMIHVDDIEPAGPGGAVRFVRRQLGVEAFGVNWFEIPPNAIGREHDESESGQEEVNVIVAGSGGTGSRARTSRCAWARFLRFDPGTTRVRWQAPTG